jgi:replicative DNA helicase
MAAKRRRPTYKNMLGNIDKDVDNMIIVHQAYPAVAGMEPEEGTDDYRLWEDTLAEVKGKAEFILALSRENEFPRRQDIQWNGSSTSFGPEYARAQNSRELFPR